MAIPGRSLAEQLPLHPGNAILLIGGDDAVAAELREAGVDLSRHALDFGPLAQVAGVPFTPPVVDWPFPDAAFAAVLLLDELALTMREEEALAEAARVLQPGGLLLLRVPATGRLAWLDGFNAYRYLHETSKRGKRLPDVAGVGWRRHYPREELAALLRPHFDVLAMRSGGVGLEDAARLGLYVYWRWLKQDAAQDGAIRRIAARVARLEGDWSVAGRGYSLLALARRLP